MFTHLFIGVFLTSIIVLNFVDQSPNWGVVATIAGLLFSLVLMWIWMTRGRYRESELIEWIHANQDRIGREPTVYPDSPCPTTSFSCETNLRDFQVVTSFLLTSAIQSSGFHIQSTLARGFIATGWTAVFGWWSIFGPIHTPKAIWRNITGGTVLSIRDILRRESK